jgi:hypothetical protein
MHWLPRGPNQDFILRGAWPRGLVNFSVVGCALTFASEVKFEIEAKISFRLEAKISFRLEAKKRPDFT